MGVEYGFDLVAHARYGNPGVDFFQAVVDETSGTCRSSEKPSICSRRKGRRGRRRRGEEERAGTRCGSGLKTTQLSWPNKCHESRHVFTPYLHCIGQDIPHRLPYHINHPGLINNGRIS